MCLKEQCVSRCGFIRGVGLAGKGFFQSRGQFCWELGLETRLKVPACQPTPPCPGFADAGVQGSCRLGEKIGQRQGSSRG